MSTFENDEDFENEIVPGTEEYTVTDYRNYIEDDENDVENITKKYQSVCNLAKQLTSLNTEEAEKNSKKTLDILTTMFMTDRLKNGLQIESVKKMALTRLTEVMPALTGQELINAIQTLSMATEKDLDVMLQPKQSGIQINMGGPSFNDNSVHNTLNQQVNYANDKKIENLEPKTLNALGKMEEAAKIFKEMNIPTQNDIQYIPNEKIITPKDVASNFIEANFKEVKKEEEKKLNED